MESSIDSPTFLLTSTYAPTITDQGTILSIDLQSNISLKSKDKYVLICLDVSGSMSGSKINTSMEAICEVIKTLFAHNSQPKVDLITFESSPKFYRLQGKSLSDCLNIVSSISAGGGTCFIPVFNMIQEILNASPEPAKENPSFLSKTLGAVKEFFVQRGDPIYYTKIEEFAVIFLSDGQAEALNKLKPHIDKLRTLAENKLSSAEFHTLGFGSDHDARLLEEMTKVMPTQGTFQYVRESAEIKGCIEAVSGCLVEKRLAAFISWVENGRTVEKKVNFVSQDDKTKQSGMESCWEGIVCFDRPVGKFEEIRNTLKLNIKLEQGYNVLEVRPGYQRPEGKSIKVRQNCAFINEQLKKISDAIINGKFDSKKAEEYRNQVANLRVMLGELVKDVFKLKIDERKMMIDSTKDLNEYMDRIGDLLRTSANSGLTNDQIASVNALAYRQVTKKSHLKTLDKRALQNVELLNQVASKVREATSRLNEKEFTEKYQSLIDEVGCCALNLSNIPDALKSQDCLCLTFDIARPEVAIQDASRIIVKKIYPTVICATAFLDCVKYSMKLNPNNSGGFDTAYQGDIVKGASNESITAALPLYLCPEHWEVASEYIKPIVGWDVTLDPLGYDYNQIRTVPFLLLIKALNDKHDNPNEFNTRVVNWLLDTCCQTIKDEITLNAQSNLLESLRPVWEKYDTDGTVRGVEVVQNNNILLAHVYCLQHMGGLKKDTEEEFMRKVRYIVEEEMRRRQDKAKLWNAGQVRKNLKKLFNLDVDKYLDQFRQEKKDEEVQTKEEAKSGEETVQEKEKRLESVFKAAKSVSKNEKNRVDNTKALREEINQAKAQENKQKALEKDKDFKFDVPQDFLDKLAAQGLLVENLLPQKFGDLDKQGKEFSGDAFQSFKNATRFLKPWFKILGYNSERLEGVEGLGLGSPIQLFALHVQNKIHHKNSDRLESFEKKEYVDSFDEEAAKKYMFRLAGQLIYNAWKKELNSKPKDMNCSREDVQFFAETENLSAAAGLLVEGFNLGSYEYFQQVVRRNPGDAKKVLEKMMMLAHKEYEGVKFKMTFHARKKFARQLYKRFADRYSYQKWKEIWYREKQKSR